MNICNSCGKENLDANKFCSECGAPLAISYIESFDDVKNPEIMSLVEVTGSVKNNNKKLIIWIVVAIVFLIVAIGISVYFTALSPDAQIKKQETLASEYMISGDYDSAIKAYKKVLELDTEDKAIAMKLGEAYLKKDDFKSAKKTFLAVIKLDKKYVKAYEKLIEVYIETGESDKIAKLYQAAKKAKVVLKEHIQPEPPTSDLKAGIYQGNKTITLSCGEGAAIYYTSDGTEPSDGSALYYENINLSPGKYTIKAVSVKDKIPSEILILEYEITAPRFSVKNEIFDNIGKTLEQLTKKYGRLILTDGYENLFMTPDGNYGFYLSGNKTDTLTTFDIRNLSGLLKNVGPDDNVTIEDIEAAFNAKLETYGKDKNGFDSGLEYKNCHIYFNFDESGENIKYEGIRVKNSNAVLGE